jgi:PleD family two-component response regulator
VTVSVGVAYLTPGPQATAETLLKAGQQALAAARSAGRNRVVALEAGG